MASREIRDTNLLLGNKCVAFMFNEIRYELDGMEVDHNRNQHVQNLSLSLERTKVLKHAAWDTVTNGEYFKFCVPLNLLLDFCEDYKRLVINALHEVILIRASTDNNYLMGDPAMKPKIEIFKNTMANVPCAVE